MKKSKANYLPRLKTGVTFYEGVMRLLRLVCSSARKLVLVSRA
jgi:hypothetical protein